MQNKEFNSCIFMFCRMVDHEKKKSDKKKSSCIVCEDSSLCENKRKWVQCKKWIGNLQTPKR